jgi:hypothetical protein
VWNKYGEASFSFEILERVEDLSLLLEREQYWIDTLKPEVNKAIKAESGFLGLKHSPETRKKLRDIQIKRLESPELIERLRQAATEQNKFQPNAMKWKKLSEEKKQSLREANKRQFSDPEKRQKHLDAMKKWATPEMRERIGNSNRGKKRSPEQKEAMSAGFLRAWSRYSEKERAERVEKTKQAVILARAKHYRGFVDPSGIIYRNVYNLSEFCREHRLSVASMCDVNLGKAKSHKGWKLLPK